MPSSVVLTVKDEKLTVEILFIRNDNQNEILNQIEYDKIIELKEIDNWSSALILKIIFIKKPQRTILITGIDGGLYLHSANEKDNSYSVKLFENYILFSLGFTFFLFDINKQDIKWKIRPDIAEVFEFYDLQDDFLLRGEHSIHRIDKDGEVKWSYGGRDIWVNIDGKPEVIIEIDKILLTDFDNNEYVINFDGETIEDKPRLRQKYKQTKKWWKFW